MAVASADVCPSEAFTASLAHSLEMLRLPDVTLKEEQQAAIKAVYEGRDVFVCLPTGYGKSLCYQTLPFVIGYKQHQSAARNSAVIVVSPLVALMEDQVSGLRRRGVKRSLLPQLQLPRSTSVQRRGWPLTICYFVLPRPLSHPSG